MVAPPEAKRRRLQLPTARVGALTLRSTTTTKAWVHAAIARLDARRRHQAASTIARFWRAMASLGLRTVDLLLAWEPFAPDTPFASMIAAVYSRKLAVRVMRSTVRLLTLCCRLRRMAPLAPEEYVSGAVVLHAHLIASYPDHFPDNELCVAAKQFVEGARRCIIITTTHSELPELYTLFAERFRAWKREQVNNSTAAIHAAALTRCHHMARCMATDGLNDERIALETVEHFAQFHNLRLNVEFYNGAAAVAALDEQASQVLVMPSSSSAPCHLLGVAPYTSTEEWVHRLRVDPHFRFGAETQPKDCEFWNLLLARLAPSLETMAFAPATPPPGIVPQALLMSEPSLVYDTPPHWALDLAETTAATTALAVTPLLPAARVCSLMEELRVRHLFLLTHPAPHKYGWKGAGGAPVMSKHEHLELLDGVELMLTSTPTLDLEQASDLLFCLLDFIRHAPHTHAARAAETTRLIETAADRIEVAWILVPIGYGDQLGLSHSYGERLGRLGAALRPLRRLRRACAQGEGQD